MTAHVAPRRNGNFVKGVLAAGAAAALGLGVFSANGGSFALWQDSAELGNRTTIQSGQLDLEAGPGTWEVDPAGAAGRQGIEDEGMAAYRVVPGDSFVYTQQVTLHAQGDNLAAELDLALPNIIAQSGNEELAQALEVTFTATSEDGHQVIRIDHPTDDTLAGQLRLGASETPRWFNEPVTVSVAVTLPQAVEGTTAQDMSVTLAPATVTATQVLPDEA